MSILVKSKRAEYISLFYYATRTNPIGLGFEVFGLSRPHLVGSELAYISAFFGMWLVQTNPIGLGFETLMRPQILRGLLANIAL